MSCPKVLSFHGSQVSLLTEIAFRCVQEEKWDPQVHQKADSKLSKRRIGGKLFLDELRKAAHR